MAKQITKKQSSPTKARRGRPARLSRQQILACALQLLEQGPDKVTVSGVARALNVAPMSLYTHIDNRDDLLMGVSELVLSHLEVELDSSLPWQQRVRDWLHQVHGQLARYPQVVKLIGAADRLPPQWLRVHATLVACLDEGGLQGETLSHTARWLAQIITTDILLNAPELPQATEASVRQAMSGLTGEEQTHVARMLPYISNTEQSLFEFVVDQAIARLEFLAEGAS